MPQSTRHQAYYRSINTFSSVKNYRFRSSFGYLFCGTAIVLISVAVSLKKSDCESISNHPSNNKYLTQNFVADAVEIASPAVVNIQSNIQRGILSGILEIIRLKD